MASLTLAKLKVTDVSTRALNSMEIWPQRRRMPDGHPPNWWSLPDDWNPPFPIPGGDDLGVLFVSDPPLDAKGKLQTQTRPVSPKAAGRVVRFEDISEGSIVPKLAAVIWPDDISPTKSSDPTPF